MKSFIFLAMLISTTVFSQDLLRINAGFRCGQPGSGIVVKVGASMSTARACEGHGEKLPIELRSAG